MQLVIVESPAKAKTIEGYLGKDFRVLASYGHIRDLPPKDGSVNPDDGFAMTWENYPDKVKRLKEISDAAKNADRLILARMQTLHEEELSDIVIIRSMADCAAHNMPSFMIDYLAYVFDGGSRA